DPALLDRTKRAMEGWLVLDGLAVTYRVGSMTGGGEKAEAVVFRSLRYLEHGRGKVDQRWETVALRRTASGLRITSVEERAYLRCDTTGLRVELLPEQGTMRGTATLRIDV